MNKIYYNRGNNLLKGKTTMALPTTSIRITSEIVEQARAAANAEFRSVQGQIEFWIKVGRTALDNPDLPAEFIAETLMSANEPRSEAKRFVPGLES